MSPPAVKARESAWGWTEPVKFRCRRYSPDERRQAMHTPRNDCGVFLNLDEKYMKVALQLAKRGRGRVSPNPLVGAVVVKDGKILGKGWHRAFGGAHAEVNALHDTGMSAADADMYVTLEPCSHRGKTPACAPLLVNAGLKRVIIAGGDPNPQVNGRGIRILENAGINVCFGILEKEAGILNQPFFKMMTQGLPYIILKSAQTLDGFVAGPDGYSRWISSEQSRKRVHRLRSEIDAVMIGGGTMAGDDPELTVRSVRGRDPKRIIFDSRFSLPEKAKLYDKTEKIETFVVHNIEAPGAYRAFLAEKGLIGIELGSRTEEGWLELLKKLAERGISSILLEGGPALQSEFMKFSLVDRVIQFTAPTSIGKGLPNFSWPYRDLRDLQPFGQVRYRKSGKDMLTDIILKEY